MVVNRANKKKEETNQRAQPEYAAKVSFSAVTERSITIGLAGGAGKKEQ